MSFQFNTTPGKNGANHGPDNRVDVLDDAVTNEQLRHTHSVGMIVHQSALSDSGDDATWLLRSRKSFRQHFDAAVEL